MMPSLFSTASPPGTFQIWLLVYVYLLPIMLYASWATLSVIDMAGAQAAQPRRWLALLIVILIPLLGAAWYLLMRARALSRNARFATVVAGTVVWILPLVAALWLVGRPLSADVSAIGHPPVVRGSHP